MRWASKSRLAPSLARRWTLDFGLWTQPPPNVSRLWTLDFGLWTPTPDFGLWTVPPSPESLSQQFDTPGHRSLRRFFALELQRDVPVIIYLGQNPGDALVIQLQRVPFAAAKIGLGLDEHRLRGDLLELLVRALQKIAGI